MVVKFLSIENEVDKVIVEDTVFTRIKVPINKEMFTLGKTMTEYGECEIILYRDMIFAVKDLSVINIQPAFVTISLSKENDKQFSRRYVHDLVTDTWEDIYTWCYNKDIPKPVVNMDLIWNEIELIADDYRRYIINSEKFEALFYRNIDMAA